jgi:hypothetical protein
MRASQYGITRDAEDGGDECEYEHGHVQTEECNTEPCLTDCVGEWSAYGECSSPCVGGEQIRTYFQSQAGRNRQGVQGAHLNPLGLFLNPLGLFLRASVPFIWHILSAFLPT